MRILHLVSSPTMTGPADPALQLARAQRSDLGLDAWIAIDRRRTGDLEEKAKALGVPVAEGLDLSTTAGPISAVGDLFGLRRVAAPFDVLHAHSSHDHALAATSAALGRSSALLVRTIHHPRSARRRGLQGFTYRRTDGFVVVAEPHRTLFLESYPAVAPERVLVSRGAVDTERFRPSREAGSELRRSFGVPEHALLFAIVSRIKPGRRHELLVRALQRLRARFPAHLAMIGKGEGEPGVRAAVEAAGLKEVVHFFGFRDADLPDAIRAADFTILLAEGNDAGCRAVLESLACGVPVIGADLPAIREALDGAGCGTLIPPDDEDALVDAMAGAAQTTDAQRRELRERARARVLERYTNRGRAELIAGFYERLRGWR